MDPTPRRQVELIDVVDPDYEHFVFGDGSESLEELHDATVTKMTAAPIDVPTAKPCLTDVVSDMTVSLDSVGGATGHVPGTLVVVIVVPPADRYETEIPVQCGEKSVRSAPMCGRNVTSDPPC